MRPYSPGGAPKTFAPAVPEWIPALPSAHRLRLGLPGYLIPFAPLAFASQRQNLSREPLSPPEFLPISTHFTAPPGIPFSPPSLKPCSFGRSSSVELRAFTPDLQKPPTRALCPVIPNNACHLRITAAAGTKLAVASSPAFVSYRRYSHPYGS